MSAAPRKLSDRQRRKLAERAIVLIEKANALLTQAEPPEPGADHDLPITLLSQLPDERVAWNEAACHVQLAIHHAGEFAQAAYPNCFEAAHADSSA